MSTKPQAEFYHVVIWMHPAAGIAIQIFHDLTESELRARFVKPYLRGETVKIESNIYDLTRIASTNIVRTAARLEQIKDKAFRDASKARSDFADAGIFMLTGSTWNEDDIVELGEEVTANFLKIAPGQGFTWKKLALNPYIIGVASAIFGSAATLIVGAADKPVSDKNPMACPPAAVSAKNAVAVSAASSTAAPPPKVRPPKIQTLPGNAEPTK